MKSHLCPGLNSAMNFTIFRFSSKFYDFSFQSSEINKFYVFCNFSLQTNKAKQDLQILRF